MNEKFAALQAEMREAAAKPFTPVTSYDTGCHLRNGADCNNRGHLPWFSRHDDACDDDSERVRYVWTYAMGYLRDDAMAEEAGYTIKRVHDHKGVLIVMFDHLPRLPRCVHEAFRKAWGSHVAGEDPDQVEFHHVDSNDAACVWDMARFPHGSDPRTSLCKKVVTKRVSQS